MFASHDTPADDALDACLYAELRVAFFTRIGRPEDAAFWQSLADDASHQYEQLTARGRA